MSANSRLKVCLDQTSNQTFYRQRIPECNCARKETTDIEILLTSRNGDRKIMQSIRIKSRPTLRIRSGTSSANLDEHQPK